jgi:hypothetical protein
VKCRPEGGDKRMSFGFDDVEIKQKAFTMEVVI